MSYRQYGHVVASCPLNETEFTAAATRLNCTVDKYGRNRYTCVPKFDLSAIVEFCYRYTVGIYPKGTCLGTLYNGDLDARRCGQFTEGCPADSYRGTDLYKFPACSQINTEQRCFYADPVCPNETGRFTNEDGTISITSTTLMNVFNTTTNTLSTLTTPVEQRPADVGVTIGIVLPVVFVLCILLAIIVWSWRRRRRRRRIRRRIYSRVPGEDLELSDWERRYLGDYSTWKTPISDQFSLSHDEMSVLFCFLCSDYGTPDFTDTDRLDILNMIREVMYSKDQITSEEEQRTLDGLKSRGFLRHQDRVHITEDAEDETMYCITERSIVIRATLYPLYRFSSYTTAVRYLRSRGYTRKPGEKCVISENSGCDSLLIRRLQMNTLTHVTMEDTTICDEVSQFLNIPLSKIRMSDDKRGAFLEDLQQTGECVQNRGGSRGSVQHVKWLWRDWQNARPDIVRSCVGLHPHCDIYIINNTAYRKHSQHHDRPPAERCLLYCLLMVEHYTVKVKDESHINMYNAIRERYFTELPVCDEITTTNHLEEIIYIENYVFKFKSDDIRHDVMYAFVTDCLVEESDLKFFLTTASHQVVSEYCRSWNYERSEGERCLYIPYEKCELFIDKLQLDILTHCTMSDRRIIHNSISGCLGVPKEILDWDQEARERYVEYTKRGTQTVHHARGMIVGCAGAGKTTLLKRLLGCSKAEILDVTSTKGLEVHEEIFEICNGQLKVKKTQQNGATAMEDTVGKKTLSVFDFGGQCVYYACHQIYLTRRAFYMVVVDASKHLDQVVDAEVCDQDGTVFSGWKYEDYFVFWIKSIHTYCSMENKGKPDPEVIIVATHWDKNVYQDNNESLIRSLQGVFPSNSTLGAKYITKKKCFVTQIKHGSPLEALSGLEKHIVDVVCQQRWVEEIPKEWAFMEGEIAQKKSKQRIEDVDDIKEKLPGEKAVYDMLRYYHDAGKVLYFNEESLHELVILDVQWFVDAFKNIITDKLHMEGVEETMDDWNEYYKTGHLKDSLLTKIWSKKDLDLHKELVAKGRTAIADDVSEDPQYLLPHKDEMMRFMNKLGLVASTVEFRYVPCMNREEFTTEQADCILGSVKKSSVLLFQFDFLPYFLFYQLVVSCMQMKNWAVLSNEKPCLYRNAAFFSSTCHHIIILVTKTAIQLQIYQPQPRRDLDTKKTQGIQCVIEEELDRITSSYNRTMKFVRGFICKNGNYLSHTMNVTGNFIPESKIGIGKKIICPLHQQKDCHFINTRELTKYWKTQKNN
ncbi:uncharacterized protein LOC125676826 [Ostrea edulis]|uniref:uncharacterized protein LOC125676826 n=1 Tax=Ostrea edulis TaxID=37623 RepID=UPI0024AFB677|nr:uncharacterized protein LOC125676826 [Ostrea edulis]